MQTKKSEKGVYFMVLTRVFWSPGSAFTHGFPSAKGLMTASDVQPDPVFALRSLACVQTRFLASESGVLMSEGPHGYW